MIPITCSSEFWECRASIWVWKIVPLILLVIGTVGNSLNIAVLSRRELRKYSTFVYMLVLVLVIADLFTLWSIPIESTLKQGYGVVLIDTFAFLCKTAAWFAYSSGAFSTWTIVNMSLERLVMTKYPLWAQQNIKPRVAIIASLNTFVLIQAMNGHLLYGHQLKSFPLPGNVSGEDIQVCYMKSVEYASFYFTTWNQLVLLAYNVIPMTIIIIGNTTIAITLISQRKKVTTQKQSNRTETRRDTAAIKTLLVISIFFVVCTSPYCIYFVILDLRFYRPDSHDAAVAKLVNTVIHVLLFVNYTFNFFLYFHRATHFRAEWVRMTGDVKNKILVSMRRCCGSSNAVAPDQQAHNSRQISSITQPSTVPTSIQSLGTQKR